MTFSKPITKKVWNPAAFPGRPVSEKKPGQTQMSQVDPKYREIYTFCDVMGIFPMLPTWNPVIDFPTKIHLHALQQ